MASTEESAKVYADLTADDLKLTYDTLNALVNLSIGRTGKPDYYILSAAATLVHERYIAVLYPPSSEREV